MPITSMTWPPPCAPMMMRRPTSPWLPPSLRDVAFDTIATSGASFVSRSVKSRPAGIGMPSVAK
jgi:hypothetical protein